MRETMAKKKHGNTGNKHAQKPVDQKKDTYLNIRINRNVLEKAKQDAAKRGMTLTDWITKIILAQK